MATLSTQEIFAGSLAHIYSSHRATALRTGYLDKILGKNASVFAGGSKQKQIIRNRLGWLEVVREMRGEIPRLLQFSGSVRADGIKHVLVLGMGGSSLCPEVFGKVFGKKPWLKSYDIVDTTAPSAIDRILRRIDLRKAFFIVSSKSGGTIETLSQFRFFFEKVKGLRPLKAGLQFAVVTDAGSPLHRIARRNRFKEIFINRPDIGGRYSALSFFGLVPGLFTKLNPDAILRGAEKLLEAMKVGRADGLEPLEMGVLLGSAANAGRDKLTFVPSGRMAPFIAWIEQLVAESTGKKRRGIIPIEGEPVANATTYGRDRVFVSHALGTEKHPQQTFLDKVRRKRHPLVRIRLANKGMLGAEMLKWEVATAVSSIILKVNPFDEPNVAESKKNTAEILAERIGRRKRPAPKPIFSRNGIDVMLVSGVVAKSGFENSDLNALMRRFLVDVKAGDYVSFLCYTDMTPRFEERLTEIRLALLTRHRIVTLRGYGPRFLHSVGQLYKGGEQKGHFIVIERTFADDYEIPTKHLTFARLIRAQALGDIRALIKRKRPVVSLRFGKDPARELDQLAKLMKSI